MKMSSIGGTKIKFVYISLLSVILLFSISIGLSSYIATADQSTTINLGSYSTYAGSNVTVPIEITNATEIAGGFANISFNPSIVNVQEVLAGDFGTLIANINNTNGVVRVAVSIATAVEKENASLARIRFKGISKGQITTLDITDTNLNYENGTVFIPETSNGSITVSTPLLMYMTSYDVYVDSNVTVPIEIKNATDIAGGSAKVVFNASIVRVEAVTAGDLDANITANIDNTNGSVHVAVATTTAVGIEEAVLVNVVFKGLSEGSTALEIQDAYLNDEYGNIIIPETSDGTIDVTEAPAPCFIATAAYGTPVHEDINILRKFRNEVLSTNTPGKAIVETYYSTSPPIANALAANNGLRTSVRVLLLTPLVYFAGITLNGGLFALIILIIASLAGLLYLYRTRKYVIFAGILKSVGLGILSIVALTSLVFTLGWLGYTCPGYAMIAAYILPLIIPIAIAVMLFAAILPKYKNESLGGE